MGKFNLWKIDGRKAHGQTSSTNSDEMDVSSSTTLPSNPFYSVGTSVDPSRSPSPSMNSQMQGRRDALQSVKNQVMINYLYQQQANSGWRTAAEKASEGVMLRVSRDRYVSNPVDLIDTPLAASLRELNVHVCVQWSSHVGTYRC